MNGTQRRDKIMQLLTDSHAPLSGTHLAKELRVSRQVIVQDIALLRANGEDIVSTNRGYILMKSRLVSRVFKVHHTDDQVFDELSLIVDCGAQVKDVFVYHKVYGTVQANLNIRSREDVKKFIREIESGQSRLLKNVTSGYHYHTVTAENDQTLDLVQERLAEAGYLAKLTDYEPVDFWQE